MSTSGTEFHALIQSLIGGAGANVLLADLSLIPVVTLAAPVEAEATVVAEEAFDSEGEAEVELEADLETDDTANSDDEAAEADEVAIAQAAAATLSLAHIETAAPEVAAVSEEQAPVVLTAATAEAVVDAEAEVDQQVLQQLLVPQQQTVAREIATKSATPQQQLVAVETAAAKEQSGERAVVAAVEPQVAPANVAPEAAVAPKSDVKPQLSTFAVTARTDDSAPDLATTLANSAQAQLAATEGITEAAQQTVHRTTTGVAGTAATMTAAELQLRSQSALAGVTEGSVSSSIGKSAVDGVALLQAAQGERSTAKGKGAATGLPRADQERTLEQIRDLIKKAAQSADGNTMVVRLDPPELGNITVKVTQRDGQVYARIIPENADVEQLLRQRANEVTQALAAVGLRADHVQLSIGRERSESETFRFQEQRGSGGGNQTGEQGSSSSGSKRGEDSAETLPKSKGPKSGPAADTADVGWVA